MKIARQLDHRKSRLLLADDKAQREQTQRQLHHEGILAGIAARATQDTENPSALAKPTTTTPANATINTSSFVCKK